MNFLFQPAFAATNSLSPFRNKVGSFTLKMENTNLSTSLFELSYHSIMLIYGNQ